MSCNNECKANNSISYNVNIILEKEKRAIFHELKKHALNNNGIIFGGMVRDEIISEHYKKKFNKFILNYKNTDGKKNYQLFWDTSIHPESSYRTLIPNDMDVYFIQELDCLKFISKIMELSGDNIEICNPVSNTNYAIDKIMVKKIIIKFYLGKTFTFKGKMIEIKIDCLYFPDIYSNKDTELEPPFNNLDFLCNSFIRTNEGIRLSKSTGTRIDTMSTLERAQVSVGILKQIVNLETEICTYKTSKNDEYIIVARILNMLNRKDGNSWNITNMPFSIENITNQDISEDICCIICQDQLSKENKKKAVIKSTNSIGKEIISCQLHKECMTKYISHQLNDYYGKFVSPYKTPLNFLEKKVDYDKFLL